MEAVLTIQEAAEILRVTPERVYELCRQGLIPHIRLGRQVRISKSKFEAWMNDGGQSLPGGWKREPGA